MLASSVSRRISVSRSPTPMRNSNLKRYLLDLIMNESVCPALFRLFANLSVSQPSDSLSIPQLPLRICLPLGLSSVRSLRSMLHPSFTLS